MFIACCEMRVFNGVETVYNDGDASVRYRQLGVKTDYSISCEEIGLLVKKSRDPKIRDCLVKHGNEDKLIFVRALHLPTLPEKAIYVMRNNNWIQLLFRIA